MKKRCTVTASLRDGGAHGRRSRLCAPPRSAARVPRLGGKRLGFTSAEAPWTRIKSTQKHYQLLQSTHSARTQTLSPTHSRNQTFNLINVVRLLIVEHINV